MTTQEQPPPDVEAPEELPPLGWNGMTRQKAITMGMTFLIVGFLVLLVSMPMVHTSTKASERTLAINNAKQVGLALLEFEDDFGKYPDESTAPLVAATTSTGLDLRGGSSNAMFRQLIAHGVMSEDIFFCDHPEFGSSWPDNRMTRGHALEPGEVSFSYVAGLDTSMPPEVPVLAVPMRLGTDRFHDKPMGSKGIILRVDHSARAFQIRATDDKLVIGGGKTLFDPSNGIWPTGHVIDLRHPEK